MPSSGGGAPSGDDTTRYHVPGRSRVTKSTPHGASFVEVATSLPLPEGAPS